ncbi:hypothetical protein ABK040_003316 [Willaertia magna]
MSSGNSEIFCENKNVFYSNNNVLIVHAIPTEVIFNNDNNRKDRNNDENEELQFLINYLGINNFKLNKSENNILLDISTKYYTTTCRLHFLNQSKTNHHCFDINNFQVIIGIGDYETDLILETILKFREEVENAILFYHDDLFNEKMKKERLFWCVENNFECIVRNELLLLNNEEEDQLLKEENEEEEIIKEKKGVERLMEVLECTMWPEMKRVEKKKNNALSSFSSNLTKEFTESNKNTTFDKKMIDDQKKNTTFSDKKKNTTTTIEEEQQVKQEKETTEIFLKEELEEEFEEEFEMKKELFNEQQELNKEEEEEFEKQEKLFDSLMGEMLFLKNQGSSLGFEERKQRAGRTALKLMEMLGEDFGEGVEEEEEEYL